MTLAPATIIRGAQGDNKMKAEDVRPSYMRPYDPQYDPLVMANPGQGTGYAPTYWVGTAGVPPEDDGPITADIGFHRPCDRPLPGA